MDVFNVFRDGVILSAAAGCGVYYWLSKRMHVPRCPNCGGKWEIIESGPSKNVDTLVEGGKCPHCGTTI